MSNISSNISNKKYKDTVFRLLFNNNKEALGLYNNLYNGHYTDESLINIVTLEDVLFMPRKNEWQIFDIVRTSVYY